MSDLLVVGTLIVGQLKSLQIMTRHWGRTKLVSAAVCKCCDTNQDKDQATRRRLQLLDVAEPLVDAYIKTCHKRYDDDVWSTVKLHLRANTVDEAKQWVSCNMRFLLPSDSSETAKGLSVLRQVCLCLERAGDVTPPLALSYELVRRGMREIVINGPIGTAVSASYQTPRAIAAHLGRLRALFSALGRDCMHPNCGAPALYSTHRKVSAPALNPLWSPVQLAEVTREAAEHFRTLNIRLTERSNDPGSHDPVRDDEDNMICHVPKGDKKHCPPANLGFCAAMMASLWIPVLDAVASPPPWVSCTPDCAYKRILSAITLHMTTFCVMFGKRPIEVLRMERYTSVVIPWVDTATNKPCYVSCAILQAIFAAIGCDTAML